FSLQCGHSFCELCVYAWFQTKLDQHHREHPGYDPRSFVPTHWLTPLQDRDLPWPTRITIVAKIDEAILQSTHPHYSCPCCRQHIKCPPVANLALKQLIHGPGASIGASTVGFGQGGIWDDLFPF
ncbi:hypothetical protein LXA43DRAFT_855257, partial [Ganoderma leucocontextum]